MKRKDVLINLGISAVVAIMVKIFKLDFATSTIFILWFIVMNLFDIKNMLESKNE